MEDKRPRFRAGTHLIVLLALAALVALYFRAEKPQSWLDPTGAYRLAVGSKDVTVERLSDHSVVARVATGGAQNVLAAWDPKRPACLVWMPSGGNAGTFWSWRDGKTASIALEDTQLTFAVVPLDGSLARQPQRRPNGAPDWVFSPDGLRVAVIMNESGSRIGPGLLLCLHPWNLPTPEPSPPLQDPCANFHTNLDGVISVAWKSVDALVVDTAQGRREVNCTIGPSQEPDEATPALSADGQYRLLTDTKTFARVERVQDGKTVWRLDPPKSGFWHIQPRWHERKTLLAVAEMTDKSGTLLHFFTPNKQTKVDLEGLGGEGSLRAPWPSADGARAVVLIAPVFGNYDVECGVPTCCHPADGLVHRLESSADEFQGPNADQVRARFPEATTGFYGVRRGNWTSTTDFEVWNTFGFEGREYLTPATRTCSKPAKPWP